MTLQRPRKLRGGEPMEKDMRIAYLYDFYGDILSEKQQLVFEMYYNDDCSLGEIAEQIGISRQGVRDCVKRCEGALTEMEHKLGLAARFEEITKDIDKIRQLAVSVGEDPNNSEGIERTKKKIEMIIQTAEELKNKF